MKIYFKKYLFIFVFALIFFLQNISDVLPGRKISLLFTKLNAVAQEPNTTIPTISVNCYQDDSQQVVFSWKAENSKYILIEGYDDQQHPVEGSIVGSGTYAFIAVGEHNIVREIKTCYPTEVNLNFNNNNNSLLNPFLGKIEKRAILAGNDQLFAEYSGSNKGFFVASSSTLDPEYFDGSYTITIKTSLSKSEIEERVRNLLQERKFTVEIKEASPNLDLFFNTNDYNLHQKLCLEPDCNLPIGKRRIERKAAFSIWMKKNTSQGNKVSYKVSIKPSVLRNFRREDLQWNLDPDGKKASFELCKELADEIEKNLN